VDARTSRWCICIGGFAPSAVAISTAAIAASSSRLRTPDSCPERARFKNCTRLALLLLVLFDRFTRAAGPAASEAAGADASTVDTMRRHGRDRWGVLLRHGFGCELGPEG
jgi:hypothetical protein